MDIQDLKNIFITNKIYQKNQVISNIDSLIGYVREYKFYKQIEFITYVIVGSTEERITKSVAEDFLNASFNYAEENYNGRGVGNNSGLISISVLVGKDIDQSAINFFKRSSKKHFAAREISILYDINTDEFYRSNFYKFPFWGVLFFKYYRKLSEEVMNLVRSANKK